MDQVMCSVEAAAKSLCVSRQTIYNWMGEGRIEGVRVGGRRLIKIASLRKLIGEAA